MRILLVSGEQNGTVISDGDIEFGKIGTPPSTLLFPLFGSLIGDPENAEKRSQEILVEGVPNKPNVPVPHPTQKPKRVDPIQVAVLGHPLPGVDDAHILPLVSEAVPGVTVEGTCLVVERGAVRIGDPVAGEKIAFGDWE